MSGKHLLQAQPKTTMTLLARIHESRREMIRPVFERPRDYVLMNVRELGQKLGVDAATVSRTVTAMGFRGYRDFQRYLHQLSLAHSTALERMLSAGTAAATLDGRVRETLNGAVLNLESVCNSLDVERLARLADRLYSAERIYVLGGDLAMSLAYFLHYQLMMLGLNVTLATSSGHVTHLMHHTTRNDLVFAISFRLGLRQTVEGVLQARANGCYTVGLTDTSISPIARSTHEVLLVPIDTAHFGASYAAAMALLDALLSAVANRKRSRTMKMLRRIDDDQKTSYRWYPES